MSIIFRNRNTEQWMAYRNSRVQKTCHSRVIRWHNKPPCQLINELTLLRSGQFSQKLGSFNRMAKLSKVIKKVECCSELSWSGSHEHDYAILKRKLLMFYLHTSDLSETQKSLISSLTVTQPQLPPNCHIAIRELVWVFGPQSTKRCQSHPCDPLDQIFVLWVTARGIFRNVFLKALYEFTYPVIRNKNSSKLSGFAVNISCRYSAQFRVNAPLLRFERGQC